MPYEMTTEAGGTGVCITVTGHVHTEDLARLSLGLMTDDSFATHRYHLWDFREAELHSVEVDDVRQLAMRDTAYVDRNPGLRIAIVGSRAFFRGVDRYVHIFQSVWTRWETATFRTMDEARAWLVQPVNPAMNAPGHPAAPGRPNMPDVDA